MSMPLVLRAAAHHPTRRSILITAASAGIAGAGAALLRAPRSLGPMLTPSARVMSIAPAANLRVLSGGEYLALASACDRVYPCDETPGATELGVPIFVDGALADSPPPSWAEGFRDGLARLDIMSRQAFGVPLCQAKPADQDALIAQWASESGGENAKFVRNLVEATLEGVLGDPSHGGNVGGLGWREFGFRPDPFSPSRVKPA
jgi:gluconate 2-dehydrogenase gamma chain